jgi:surfactin synthase thioesterase subunit
MARAIAARNRRLAVYGVELPGHDPAVPYEPLADVPELARLIAAEVEATIDTPLMLWGHCSGAAPAIELAGLLEARGADVRALLLGAKLLYPPEQLRESIDAVRAMDDPGVISWMVEVSDFTAEDGLDRAQTELIGRTFRHDALTAHRYFIGAQQHPRRPLATPVTVVVTADDRIVETYSDDWTSWRKLAADVRLRVLDHGGHYFMRRAAEPAAAVVDEVWAAVVAQVVRA